jgi:Cu/Ag efflux protein CusF
VNVSTAAQGTQVNVSTAAQGTQVNVSTQNAFFRHNAKKITLMCQTLHFFGNSEMTFQTNILYTYSTLKNQVNKLEFNST